MQSISGTRLTYQKIAVFIAILLFLLVVSFYNFLLFHTAVELFSILVGFGISAIALHTNNKMEKTDKVLIFLGVAYFFISLLDLLHTLAYEGMGVFPGSTANMATQFWIISRYLEALAFLAVPFIVTQYKLTAKIAYFYPVATVAAIFAVFTGNFPDCFIPGTGLTMFKIISEYIISAILIVSAVLIIKHKHYFDRDMLKYMLLACAATIIAELSFTFYVSVYGLSNIVGHFFKLASFYFIYVIVIRKKLLEPYDQINDLYKNMERQVATRTRELEAANLRLKEGQKTLSQLNQKLSESNRLKSEFMATMTHELRTPLTSVVAFCELLLDEIPGPLNQEQRENLLDIKTGSQQLMILINDILDMAKYEAGRLRLVTERVDLNEVFDVVQRTMSAIAQQKNIKLIVDAVNVPSVFGDPDRIIQMIVNLVSNAIKFTNEGGQIQVSAYADNGFAAITVQDTGEGIAPEFLPHIFEKFRQGDASAKRRRSGTGLGLALVKTLAQMQGGSVSVTSEVGAGTQFTIHLPFAEQMDSEE